MSSKCKFCYLHLEGWVIFLIRLELCQMDEMPFVPSRQIVSVFGDIYHISALSSTKLRQPEGGPRNNWKRRQDSEINGSLSSQLSTFPLLLCKVASTILCLGHAIVASTHGNPSSLCEKKFLYRMGPVFRASL